VINDEKFRNYTAWHCMFLNCSSILVDGLLRWTVRCDENRKEL
jgi:hypothetical protein